MKLKLISQMRFLSGDATLLGIFGVVWPVKTDGSGVLSLLEGARLLAEAERKLGSDDGHEPMMDTAR